MMHFMCDTMHDMPLHDDILDYISFQQLIIFKFI